MPRWRCPRACVGVGAGGRAARALGARAADVRRAAGDGGGGRSGGAATDDGTGRGPVTALTYRAVLDDVTRFRRRAECRGVSRAGAARRQLGRPPAQRRDHESGPDGAARVIGPSQRGRSGASGPAAAALHAWVERLAARRGRRIAVVALARRLARILYAMWRDGQDYHAVPVKG